MSEPLPGRLAFTLHTVGTSDRSPVDVQAFIVREHTALMTTGRNEPALLVPTPLGQAHLSRSELRKVLELMSAGDND